MRVGGREKKREEKDMNHNEVVDLSDGETCDGWFDFEPPAVKKGNVTFAGLVALAFATWPRLPSRR